jgi:hypothetical protein
VRDDRRDERIDMRGGEGFVGYRYELYKRQGGLRSLSRERYGYRSYRSRPDDD